MADAFPVEVFTPGQAPRMETNSRLMSAGPFLPVAYFGIVTLCLDRVALRGISCWSKYLYRQLLCLFRKLRWQQSHGGQLRKSDIPSPGSPRFAFRLSPLFGKTCRFIIKLPAVFPRNCCQGRVRSTRGDSVLQHLKNLMLFTVTSHYGKGARRLRQGRITIVILGPYGN